MHEPSSLRQLITEYLAQRPGQALTPWQTAEGISARLDGHHVGVGTVINTCHHEAAQGCLVQVDLAPAPASR